MIRTAVFDPIVVEPRITPEKVRELVERRAESAKLDYKLTYLASEAENRFRLVKHSIAMANTAGGYIVVGVGNDGALAGVAPEVLDELDEAKVRAQVTAACSAPIPLFVTTGFSYEGVKLAIITVLPLDSRLAVTAIDAQYSKGEKQHFVFRKGAVLVRHGSSSEPWSQDDADYLLDRLTSGAKQRWREEFAADFGEIVRLAGTHPRPPVGADAFRKTPEEFRRLVVDLMRERDE